MASIRHLPVVQNWDCHVCGTCCKEYQVTITDEEHQRIEEQGWDPERDLEGYDPFVVKGPPWARRYQLNHRADGSCVFLDDKGRCRIHAKHGYETKPLDCRLFPFVLIPQGDGWGVSVRYACPSAAENKGRPLDAHDDTLHEFASRLAEREGLTPQPDGSLTRPPALQSGQRVDWPDLLRIVRRLVQIVRNSRERVERRLRKCLALATLCRQAKFDTLNGVRLDELLHILANNVELETPVRPEEIPAPSWVGRVLFRQAAALYTRKDHGPNRGVARKGRLSLLFAAWRFARGRGPVPRMHNWIPETTFEHLEQPIGPLDPLAEQALERYYTIKVGSLQFCGAPSFGMSFWEGFEALALTYPIILWVTRAFVPALSHEQAVMKALSIVDDHFGFNRVLGTLRQRLSFQILARRGELTRLIAWYSR